MLRTLVNWRNASILDISVANDAPSIPALTERLLKFRDDRDWSQFQSLKELILSLNLEASELLELTQWQSAEQFEAAMADSDAKNQLQHECADVFVYLLLIAERAGFDLPQATATKIEINEAKYPIDKSRGKSTKYTEL